MLLSSFILSNHLLVFGSKNVFWKLKVSFHVHTWKQWETLSSWAPQSLLMLTAVIKLKDACSLEECYDKLNVLKSRDTTWMAKVCLVKVKVFQVVMYGCVNWIIKKAECWRSDAFKLWCWRRLLDSKAIKPINPKGN